MVIATAARVLAAPPPQAPQGKAKPARAAKPAAVADRVGEIRKFEGHGDQVLCAAFAPDGRRFVSGASIQDPVARIWNVATGEVVCRLEGNTEAVYAVAFAPDGRTVLTGGEDDSIRHWDAASGRQIVRFQIRGSFNVHAVAFLPDGRRALSGSEDLELRLWDLAEGRELEHFEGHFEGIGLIAVLPDGLHALTAGGDRTVRLWKLPRAARPASRGRSSE